jgi:hypothetical protein
LFLLTKLWCPSKNFELSLVLWAISTNSFFRFYFVQNLKFLDFFDEKRMETPSQTRATRTLLFNQTPTSSERREQSRRSRLLLTPRMQAE